MHELNNGEQTRNTNEIPVKIERSPLVMRSRSWFNPPTFYHQPYLTTNGPRIFMTDTIGPGVACRGQISSKGSNIFHFSGTSDLRPVVSNIFLLVQRSQLLLLLVASPSVSINKGRRSKCGAGRLSSESLRVVLRFPLEAREHIRTTPYRRTSISVCTNACVRTRVTPVRTDRRETEAR